MNEYWQAEEIASFCFCYDSTWFQMKCDDPSANTWEICTVEVENGLPNEMTQNYYNEVNLETMLESVQWSGSEFEAQVATLLTKTD